MDSTLIQKRSMNPKRRSWFAPRYVSIDRPVDWPCPSVDRSVDRDQQRALSFSQSTALVNRLLSTFNRAVDRAVPMHVMHISRSGPVSCLAVSCILAPF